jgi:hypothetical protein
VVLALAALLHEEGLAVLLAAADAAVGGHLADHAVAARVYYCPLVHYFETVAAVAADPVYDAPPGYVYSYHCTLHWSHCSCYLNISLLTVMVLPPPR